MNLLWINMLVEIIQGHLSKARTSFAGVRLKFTGLIHYGHVEG
jgi:hypothetical protein